MGTSSRILVVEDEAVVAKDLQTRLRKLGYDVPVTVPTGEEAIEQARELRPALILMDIRLKGQLDGIEAAARIQEHVRTPVIYLTAYADEGTLGRAKLTEPFGYILKPFNERELHTAIQVAIHKHSAEIALRKSERWLSATLQGMGEAVIATDETGRILFMNPLAQSLTGWPSTEAVGRPLGEVFQVHNADTGVRVEDALLLSIREGRPANLPGDNVLITREGPPRSIEDSTASIRDDDGNIRGGVLVFRDVTERKVAQEALRISEQKFRLLVNGIHEYAIYMLTPSGDVASWNPGSERILGYTEEEILGWHFSVFLPGGESRSRRSMDGLQLAARNGVHREETWRVRKDGTQFLADTVLTVLRDSAGRTTGFVELTRDITERRRDEEHMQQAQKLESLGVLAGGIAHDFNNLLTSILGNCSLVLADLAETDPKRAALQAATLGCIKAAELTQQLLSYAGKSPLRTQPVDLSTLVRDIRELVRTSISRHVSLNLQLADGLPLVEGDPAKLQQVIMNLVINAAESMNGVTGSVLVKTGVEGDRAELIVQDTGCGMDDHTLARIFDPFFTTKFLGRGLGLAAVQGIVSGHGGELSVESSVGVGTTFKLLLPCRVNDGPPRSTPAVRQKEVRGTEYILVVDDEEMVRGAAGRCLQTYGYKPVLADGGTQALGFLNAGRKFDLVLLDLTMPEMSGAEVLPLLREISREIPVIISTGYDRSALDVSTFRDPNLYFLQKPYSAVQLATKIRGVLDKDEC